MYKLFVKYEDTDWEFEGVFTTTQEVSDYVSELRATVDGKVFFDLEETDDDN